MTDDFPAALELALRQLGASDRYESEVRRKLSAFTPAVVDRVVARLREKGVLDEDRTTQSAVERNRGRSAVGVNLLEAKLMRRGAPRETIDLALAGAETSEAERAKEALVAKYRDRRPGDRAKAGRFLVSRGFDEEAIDRALDTVFGQSTDPSAMDVFTE